MSELTFCLCTMAELENVRSFLDENWGSQHPLVHNEAFLQHYYVDGERLQFAFALEDGEPVALAGYILANKSDAPDIWVSIWCAKKGHNGTGLELMAALPRLTGARMMACNNIRPKTIAFYEFLGYMGAELPQWYRLADKSTYTVASITAKNILPVGAPCGLVKICESDLAGYTPCPDVLPAKDAWYIARRYFHYPYRSYDVYARKENGRIAALLCTRTEDVEGTKVLRIVDYIGVPQAFGLLGGDIDALLQSTGAEYADMYCYGIPEDAMHAAGFCKRTHEDENIIPNYLTPLLRENTDYYFFTSHPENFVMCKADGDQDRVNLSALGL